MLRDDPLVILRGLWGGNTGAGQLSTFSLLVIILSALMSASRSIIRFLTST